MRLVILFDVIVLVVYRYTVVISENISLSTSKQDEYALQHYTTALHSIDLSPLSLQQ